MANIFNIGTDGQQYEVSGQFGCVRQSFFYLVCRYTRVSLLPPFSFLAARPFLCSFALPSVCLSLSPTPLLSSRSWMSRIDPVLYLCD